MTMMSKIILAILIPIILVIVIVINSMIFSIKRNENMIIERCNNKNGGIITEIGDIVYFRDNKGIYKITDNKKEKIFDGLTTLINSAGEWIYFHNSETNSIWRVNINGLEKEEILLKKNIVAGYRSSKSRGGEVNVKIIGSWFYIENENLFFCGVEQEDDVYLYKADLEGNIVDRIPKERTWRVLIANNKVFYYSSSFIITDFIEKKRRSLNIVPLDFVVSDKHIYYSDPSGKGKIYRISMNGEDTKLICDIGYASNMILYKNWLYFIDGYYNNWLYKVNVNSGERIKLLDFTKDIEKVCISNDQIYFNIYPQVDIYKCNLDGSNIQKVK